METNITLENSCDFDREHTRWTSNIFYSLIMAVMLGCCYLLFSQIMIFSASLDVLTGASKSELFISASRIAASIIVLLLVKEVYVAFLAFSQITQRNGNLDRSVSSDAMRTVSVVVPAFNEGETIEDTIRSLIDMDYPDLEIVIVDDGSTDDTFTKAQSAADRFGSGRTISVLTQANGGKWKALNRGIAQSSGELVLCIDSDSILRPDALRHMAPHFQDAAVAAVSGQVRVRNKSGFITKLQALEYLVANGSLRTAQSGDGCVLIVPGPIGLFRRAALEEVQRSFFKASSDDNREDTGPFSRHTFAEDFELSVMICVTGGRVVYEPKACALTRVPDTMTALLSQRYRWMRGAMQVASRYRREKWDRLTTNGSIRRWMTLSTTGDLYLVPASGLLLLGAAIWSLSLGEAQAMLTLWAMVLAIHACAALMFIRAQGEDIKLAALSPFQSLYGAILITGVWTHAVHDHITRRAMKW